MRYFSRCHRKSHAANTATKSYDSYTAFVMRMKTLKNMKPRVSTFTSQNADFIAFQIRCAEVQSQQNTRQQASLSLRCLCCDMWSN